MPETFSNNDIFLVDNIELCYTCARNESNNSQGVMLWVSVCQLSVCACACVCVSVSLSASVFWPMHPLQHALRAGM